MRIIEFSGSSFGRDRLTDDYRYLLSPFRRTPGYNFAVCHAHFLLVIFRSHCISFLHFSKCQVTGFEPNIGGPIDCFEQVHLVTLVTLAPDVLRLCLFAFLLFFLRPLFLSFRLIICLFFFLLNYSVSFHFHLTFSVSQRNFPSVYTQISFWDSSVSILPRVALLIPYEATNSYREPVLQKYCMCAVPLVVNSCRGSR